MKKHFTFLGFLLGILITTLSSCSTTQTFTVRGVPGTVISKDNMQIAVIDPSGQAQIMTNRINGYEPFYLAKAPNSNLQVPFALDYKNHNRNAGENVAMGIAFPAEFVGLLMCIVGGATGNTSLLLAGLVPVSLSVALAIGYLSRGAAAKDEMNFQYDYLKIQTTNNDLIK